MHHMPEEAPPLPGPAPPIRHLSPPTNLSRMSDWSSADESVLDLDIIDRADLVYSE